MSTDQGLTELWKRQCSGNTWGFIAVDVEDPPQCVSDCRARFLKDMLPEDETFESVCEVLTDKDHMDKAKPFRALYCCDSQLCGVDNVGGGGKDPNVNWLINACQDIGYHSIVDPGPPDEAYTCTFGSIYDDDPRCQSTKQPTKTDASERPMPSSSTSDALAAEKLSTDPSTLTPSLTTSFASAMPEKTYSRITDPSLTTTQDSSTSEDSPGGKAISTGVKITIVLCTLLGLAAIAAIIFCLFRRKLRRRGTPASRRHIKHHTLPGPAESPTPLVSPTCSHTDADGVPLTPPARLRERKFLVDQNFSPEARRQDRRGFPASPLYSPSATKLVPRHERTPKIYGGGASPPLSRISEAVSVPDGTVRYESMSSFASDTVTHNSTGSIPPPAVLFSNGSPTRPPRPSEAALKLAGLASPGPPPTRALPSTPSATTTPTSPNASTSRPGGIGIALGAVPRSPSQPVTFRSDLYDLAEEYVRDSHTSWGSWGGTETSQRKKALNSSGSEQQSL